MASTDGGPLQRLALADGWADELEHGENATLACLAVGGRSSFALGHVSDFERGPLTICTHPSSTSAFDHPFSIVHRPPEWQRLNKH